jgi:hypothetical protein
MLSRIPFDPREERVIDSMARWMGVLGRFQVLAGGLLMLTVIGVAIAYGTTEAFTETDPAQLASATAAEAVADTAPPLVTLGEVTIEALLALGAVCFALGTLVLWGGVMMIDAAEDFERVHTDDQDQRHVANALRRMRSYYRIEALLTLLVLAAALAWAIPGWA